MEMCRIIKNMAQSEFKERDRIIREWSMEKEKFLFVLLKRPIGDIAYKVQAFKNNGKG